MLPYGVQKPLACCLLVFAFLVPLAAQAKHGSVARDGFYFGMRLTEAEALIKSNPDYVVAYRVDTTDTNDIFCRYQDHTLYLSHFLRGQCCSVEKRAIVNFDDTAKMFDAYFKALGNTDEVAISADRKSRYARWRFKDRELSLTAYGRDNGTYLLVHEETDTMRMGEAQVLQQRQLSTMPQQTDPLTGKALPLSQQPAEQAVEQQAADSALPSNSPASTAAAAQWQAALPQSDAKGNAKAYSKSAPVADPPVASTGPVDATQPAPAPAPTPAPAKKVKEKKVKQKPARLTKAERAAARKAAAEKAAADKAAAAQAAADKAAAKDKAKGKDDNKDKPADPDKVKPSDRPRITDKNDWN